MKNSLYTTRHKIKEIFTLVEVTMAIAVMAIGMMGIMALFPIGFQATKNAVGDNYSSELADQFLNLIAMQSKMYSTNDGGATLDGWGDWITGDGGAGTGDLIPVNKDASPEVADPDAVSTSSNEVVPGLEGIYKIDQAAGLYYVEAKSESIKDFSAVMALWKGEIPYWYDSNLDGTVDTEEHIPYKNAVRLYLEISWPASLPYKQRKKRYYVRDVFTPVER